MYCPTTRSMSRPLRRWRVCVGTACAVALITSTPGLAQAEPDEGYIAPSTVTRTTGARVITRDGVIRGGQDGTVTRAAPDRTAITTPRVTVVGGQRVYTGHTTIVRRPNRARVARPDANAPIAAGSTADGATPAPPSANARPVATGSTAQGYQPTASHIVNQRGATRQYEAKIKRGDRLRVDGVYQRDTGKIKSLPSESDADAAPETYRTRGGTEGVSKGSAGEPVSFAPRVPLYTGDLDARRSTGFSNVSGVHASRTVVSRVDSAGNVRYANAVRSRSVKADYHRPVYHDRYEPTYHKTHYRHATPTTVYRPYHVRIHRRPICYPRSYPRHYPRHYPRYHHKPRFHHGSTFFYSYRSGRYSGNSVGISIRF